MSNIPNSFKCPISLGIMRNPYIDTEGHSYERDVIYEWIGINPISPITRQPLCREDLTPNRGLADAIKNFTNNNQGFVVQDQPCQNLKMNIKSHANFVSINIEPPKSERESEDVICVIDVSGSMGSDANTDSEDKDGLSILDIVKHSVLTIIKVLGPQDRLGIVAYNSKATVELNLTKMDAYGKENAQKSLTALIPGGTTNIWDGLFKGMELLRQRNVKSNSTLFLLTDGQPNVVPPRGHIPMLKRYDDQFGLPCTINTFGFGYRLDSKLLNEFASEGNGNYSFIPDTGLTGTVFVNSISNALSTFANSAKLSVEIEEVGSGDSLVATEIPLGALGTSWGFEMNIGSIRSGQEKNVVFKFGDKVGKITATLKYTQKGVEKSLTEDKSNFRQIIEVDNKTLLHSFRMETIKTIITVLEYAKFDHFKCASDQISTLVTKIKNSGIGNDPFARALIQDLEGQIKEGSTNKKFYQKWGGHFLPSLAGAHFAQECNNFKDPGVQKYGGDLFREIRDMADQIFCDLPPPTPSNIQQVKASRTHKYVPLRNVAASYYNASGGCIAGTCLVEMGDGSKKQVCEIVKGDVVKTGMGTSPVKCVIETITNGDELFVTLGDGLVITSWHPVKFHKWSPKDWGHRRSKGRVINPLRVGEWQYPAEIAPEGKRDCSHMYNFVLENGEGIMINGIECITLGHGITGSKVAKHPYFGSKVIEDLQKVSGWNSGRVTLKSGCWERDINTGLVSGLFCAS